MKKILFRGKRIDNNKWVEGYYVKFDTTHNIYVSEFLYKKWTLIAYPVIAESVGQYINCRERSYKNDKKRKIFTGDIVRCYGNANYNTWEYDEIFEVVLEGGCLNYIEQAEFVEILGNKYDIPELLN